MSRFLFLTLFLGCNAPPSAEDLASTRGGRVDVFFNDPGTTDENGWDPDIIDVMVDVIDNTQATLDFAAMGFSETRVVEAVVRAYDRGVEVRMVGDAGHVANSGYVALRDRHIPMQIGNLSHIMHDKFLVSDRRFVLGTTANWTHSDLRLNSNNGAVIDSPAVAADFLVEFEQMFQGKFGHTKETYDGDRVYEVGDTTVEVWFSPNEDAMGRILEVVDAAEESVRFEIFAFTKDQLGSALVRKQEAFDQQNEADGIDEDADFRDKRSVAGVVDQSQLHSNGQYHEAYRLLDAGIPLRLDGNDHTEHPGDYQAGGGRLHSKTMVIDAYGEHPVVITGSFNWSASATQSNDEYLLVMHGARAAAMHDGYFESLWRNGRSLGNDRVANGKVEEGDVVVNEIMWYGVSDVDVDGYDQFVELRNRTDHPISLDMWQIANANDFVLGFPPGSTVPANDTVRVVDHVLEAYVDGAPQDEGTNYVSADLVLNVYNDNRQSRLYLKGDALGLTLQDPDGVVIDRAGDGGPAFAGGPDGSDVRSMERRSTPGNGALPGSWYACTADEGGELVNPDMRDEVLATPDEENSPE